MVQVIEVIEEKIQVFLVVFLHHGVLVLGIHFMVYLKFYFKLLVLREFVITIRHVLILELVKCRFLLLLLPELSMVSLVPTTDYPRVYLMLNVLVERVLFRILLGFNGLSSIQMMEFVISHILLPR
jgi:hypothetical protein